MAGRFAFTLFALGIIGTGLLALPVLAGSAAYAIGEVLGESMVLLLMLTATFWDRSVQGVLLNQDG